MTRTKVVSREKYRGFRDKAEGFYAGMLSEFEAATQDPRRYNNCVSLAVHCAISWVDALTVFRLGKKSSDSNHASAIALLKEAQTPNEEKKAGICNDLYQLIEMKTPAEYEDRQPSKADAEKAVHLCKKIHKIIKNQHDRRDPAASCAVYLIRS